MYAPRTGWVLVIVLVAMLAAGATGSPRDHATRHYSFEHDRPGQIPAEWALGCTPASRTEAEVTRSRPASGRQCVRITKHGDIDFGNLVQNFDAIPYRGKRVRFRASVRVQPSAPHCRAQLWLRVDRKGGAQGYFDNMQDRPVRSPNWASYAIVGNVAADAERIYIGVLVFDSGQVWFDDVTFEIIGEAKATEPANAPPIEGIAVAAVKDFMRLENTGRALEDLRFPRYFPVIDEDQLVVGRWVGARTDDGKRLRIRVADVAPDPQGNLIHTYELPRVPADEGVVVTVTSLVLRRERPAPEGAFPIPPVAQYPEDVRPFLRSTEMIAVDHPHIRAAARKILDETNDAYEVAGRVAALMRDNTYEQRGDVDYRLPTSARVLTYGGSCCGSAVCAAAILRSCRIPTQVTYCPAGYIHGIVRFYLDGYGWCRMDSTSGVGRLPLVQSNDHRGLIRLYDMPIEMEKIWNAYAWPFEHNTVEGDYVFLSDGERVPTVRFAARDQEEARRAGRVSGRVSEPFPHLEPGSWNEVLTIEDWDIPDEEWRELAAASRECTLTDETGIYQPVLRLLADRAGRAWRARQIRQLKAFGSLPGGR